MTVAPLDPPIVVARTPMLPWHVAERLLNAPDPICSVRDYLASAPPHVLQALYVASPSACGAVRDWLAGKPLRNKRTPSRALAYVLRMAARPIPFGLFASIANVAVADGPTTLLLDGTGRVTRSRPDMQWLMAVARAAESNIDVRRELRFSANEYVTRRGSRFYVTNPDVSAMRDDGTAVSLNYEPISLKRTRAVELVLSRATGGASHGELCEAVASTSGASRDRVEALIDQMWSAGLLVSSLRPSPVGVPAAQLLAAMPASAARYRDAVRDVTRRLAALDETPLVERSLEDYESIVRTATPFAECKSYFQADMMHGLGGTLDASLVREAGRLAEICFRSSPRCGLKRYRERFLERYGSTEMRVPLLDLVDPDGGIGPPPPTIEPDGEMPLVRRKSLIELATKVYGTGVREVDLSDDELDACIGPMPAPDDLPDTFETTFEIAAGSLDEIRAGRYSIVLSSLVTTEAARSVGRFADMLGPQIVERIRRLYPETDDGVLDAELVYAPASDRSANVATRPPLHNAEIRFGIGSPSEQRGIPLSDIVIGLENDRVTAWSLTLGRQLRVHESHLLNPASNAPNACALLGLLADDGKVFPAAFNWDAANMLPMRPRVRFGRLVLALANWTIARSQFSLKRKRLGAAVEAWRRQWNVPAIVMLEEQDQRIPLNLDTETGLGLLADRVRDSKAETLAFREIYPGGDELWLSDGGDRYRTEFVASFACAKPSRTVVPFRDHDSVLHPERKRGPGSEWLYAKLYCGARRIDELLIGSVAPLVAGLLEAGTIAEWFFVRFGDPHSHLRLRLKAATKADQARLFDAVTNLCEQLAAENVIHHYGFDTYVRELERYGGFAYHDAIESIFHLDSTTCVADLATDENDYDERVHRTIASFDRLVLKAVEADTLRAFLNGIGRPVRRLTNNEWIIVRESQGRIQSNGEVHAQSGEAIAHLAYADRAGSLSRPLSDVLRSLLHMHCNRMAIAEGADERSLNGLLWHVYNGLLQRKGTGSPSNGVTAGSPAEPHHRP